MPAPRADIDREGICASIALKGYRETARSTGVPIGTVHRIGKLAGVVAPDPAMRPPQRITEVRPYKPIGTVEQLGTAAMPAHAVITDELTENGKIGRLAASRIAARTLPYVADMARTEPETALGLAANAKLVVGIAQGANVPGFERQAQAGQGAVVNIALLGMEPVQVQVGQAHVEDQSALDMDGNA